MMFRIALLTLIFFACFVQAPPAQAQYAYQSQSEVQSFWFSKTMSDGLLVSVSVYKSRGAYTSFWGETLTMGPLRNDFWYVQVQKLECVKEVCRYVQTFYHYGQSPAEVSSDEIKIDAEGVKLSLKKSGGMKSYIVDPRSEANIERRCATVDEVESGLFSFVGTLTYDGGDPIDISGTLTLSNRSESAWTPNDNCYGGGGKG